MAVPTSASDLFDTLLPPKIAATPDKAREINAIYQFNITGEGGGEWNVDLSSAGPAITQGTKPGANCTIEVANADFVNMLKNPRTKTF